MLPRISFEAVLATLLTGLLLGCSGTVDLGGSPHVIVDDDDDATADDDDATADDDDVGPDDDDQVGVIGYFFLLATLHHPQGRSVNSYGYYFVDPDAGRGAKFGCDIRLPDDDEARGEEAVTLDAGPWAQLSSELPDGDAWAYDLEQEVDGETIYYLGSSTGGNPVSAPPSSLLDFQVPGGDDLPAMSIPEALPTHAPFGVISPALDPGADLLLIDPVEGLTFEWPPEGEEAVEIVLAFFSDDGERAWTIDCNVEDTGSFELAPDSLADLPRGMTGFTWIRRYASAWHPQTDDHPDMFMQGALQHRWFVQLLGETDPAPGADDDG